MNKFIEIFTGILVEIWDFYIINIDRTKKLITTIKVILKDEKNIFIYVENDGWTKIDENYLIRENDIIYINPSQLFKKYKVIDSRFLIFEHQQMGSDKLLKYFNSVFNDLHNENFFIFNEKYTLKFTDIDIIKMNNRNENIDKIFK